ncbi:tail fiber domain-containing protein [Jiulongibacter sediminis]|uniref:tail fiber domain-containing protein n=1 Tax=Jiulongibacter sediminis TaxID=1605367 RepID=UPI0006DC2CF9|nr:tail fiber domain-containing protein [Jiulongibacter sediminis]
MLKNYILRSGLVLVACLLQSQVSLRKKTQKELNEVLGGSEAKAVEAYFHTGSGSIDGSLCVGNDCVASESFGFDTQRFKENNLRVHFDDTSTSASFPANDWRIVINDDDNGGGNYFAVQDATASRTPFLVEAGARNNALYVESDGDIGIGTQNPVIELHVAGGDTPGLRLEQNATSGFEPQTWDLAGNETSFFIRDASNGSTLPFRVRPGSPSNALVIDTDGDIGMGVLTPAGPLHIKGSEDLLLLDSEGKLSLKDSLILQNKGIKFPDGSVQTIAFGGSNGAYTDLDVTGTAHFMGDVYVKGSIFPSASFGPSDKRLKQSLIDLKDASGLLMKLYPKSYYFKQEFVRNLGLPEELQYGLLAQDVESILPELIKEFDTGSGGRYKSVNYTSIVPILIQGFKEQEERIRSLEEELKSMASLEKRIKQLESASQKSTFSNAKR